MGQLTIWHGGVKVFPIEKETPLDKLPPDSKFKTCEYRSPDQQTRSIKGCCSAVQKKGYACNKLDIFPLTPEVCQGCAQYIKKSTA